jgi:hypothetical protein
MGSAVLQGRRFANVKESRFHNAKCSDMGSAILQGGQIFDSQQSRFQAAKLAYMVSAVLNLVDFLILRNIVLRLRNFQK